MIRSFIKMAAISVDTGGVAGVLGIDQRPRFQHYVIEQHHPSFQYRESVRVGAILAKTGVTYYRVPDEYGAPKISIHHSERSAGAGRSEDRSRGRGH